FSVVPLSPPLEYNRDVPWLQHTSHRHGRGRIHLQKGHLPVRVTAYMKGSARSPALGGPAGDEFALPRAGGGRRAVAASPPHPSVKRRRPRARGAARAGREERERLRRRRLGREARWAQTRRRGSRSRRRRSVGPLGAKAAPGWRPGRPHGSSCPSARRNPPRSAARPRLASRASLAAAASSPGS
ncbi:unnamed protein product, partial [Prorocentrum cordatum]